MTTPPPGAQLSDDGFWWWDGTQWQAVAADFRAAPPNGGEQPDDGSGDSEDSEDEHEHEQEEPGAEPHERPEHEEHEEPEHEEHEQPEPDQPQVVAEIVFADGGVIQVRPGNPSVGDALTAGWFETNVGGPSEHQHRARVRLLDPDSNELHCEVVDCPAVAPGAVAERTVALPAVRSPGLGHSVEIYLDTDRNDTGQYWDGRTSALINVDVSEAFGS